MGSGLASDTDALQLDAGFGAPGGHALPLLLNRVCICVIRVVWVKFYLGASEAKNRFEFRLHWFTATATL